MKITVVGKKWLGTILTFVLLLQTAVPIQDVWAAQQEEGALVSTNQKDDTAILKNCSVTILKDGLERTEGVKQTENSIEVKVKLDDKVPSCYMNLYAYAGNMVFDPDSEQNIRLYTKEVRNNETVSCTFDPSKLKVGYKVIASINVPIRDDWYKPLNSQALEIVDEHGNGFKDYDYPDMTIDESRLEAGATTLHISLTGDERIFQAAKEGKTSLNCSVRQYPADEELDFEAETQTTLCSIMGIKDPFTAKEVTLDQPLKEGYRVRAVVYWEQNTDLFLAKGNDYEAVFHKPDDSVLIEKGTPSKAEEKATVAFVGEIKEKATQLAIKLTGDIPDDSIILVKSYEADETIDRLKGQFVASQINATEGQTTLTVTAENAKNLTVGRKVVAFVVSGSDEIAQTAPYVIQVGGSQPTAAKAAFEGDIKEGAASVTVNLTGSIPTGSVIIVKSYGSSDPIEQTGGEFIVNKFDVTTGKVTLDIPTAKAQFVTAGRKLVAFVLKEGNFVAKTDAATVIKEGAVSDNGIKVKETKFTTESKSATVTVTGNEKFADGRLILTTGSANQTDADNRTQIASVTFIGPKEYQVSFNGSAKLKNGDTILPHLYKYDANADRTMYQYGEHVTITLPDGVVIPSKVEFATDKITADRQDIWVTVSFDSSKEATLELYTFEGDTFSKDKATEIYSGAISSQESSQRIPFGAGKLTAGHRIMAVLKVGEEETQSSVKVIQVVPQKEEPTVAIAEKEITKGDTHLKATITIDKSVGSASYKLYQFAGETVNLQTDQVLAEGIVYKSNPNIIIGGLANKLVIGKKIQVVMMVEGKPYYSNIMTVSPSPDWGTPSAVFDVSSIYSDAKTIPIFVQYDDRYLTFGEEFYCDVTIYQFSGSISEEEFIEGEMWENQDKRVRVAQINSTRGDETRGHIEVPVLQNVKLEPGDKMIVKLRLPHTEWEGEEVDYVSQAIPILQPGQALPEEKVLLYNLGDETERGHRVRTILNNLKIAYVTVEEKSLYETIGYLAGIEGYESVGKEYTGAPHTTEFMLMSGLSEATLDKFLAAMQENGLRIRNKAVVTEYNKETPLIDLIEDIKNEDETFHALIELDKMVKEAEKLSEAEYGSHKDWATLQEAIKEGNTLLGTHEPPVEDLEAAYQKIEKLYLSITNQTKLEGNAVISIEKDEDGTYTVTADMKDGEPDAVYQYHWRTGETTKSVDKVPADKLIGMTVSITADKHFGEKTAQLSVPDIPQATITSEKNRIRINWKQPVAKDNCPLPETYQVSIYLNGTLVKEVKYDAAQAVAIVDGLSEGKSYLVKAVAVSPVGRSTFAEFTATTSSSGGSGGGGSSSSSSGGSGGGSSQDSNQITTETKKDGTVIITEKKKDGTIIETTKEPDGTVTITEKKPDGSIVETTKKPDGSTIVVETKKDGTVATKIEDKNGNKEEQIKNADGTKETTITKKDGTISHTVEDKEGTTKTEVKVSENAVKEAAKENEIIELPMPSVTVPAKSETAPRVTIDVENDAKVDVQIPVIGVTSGTVAVKVNEDGTREVIRKSVANANGLQVSVDGTVTIEIVDNAKHFEDTKGHWASEAIDFVSSHELYTGTALDKFSPNMEMTRGMLVTVLYNLEGNPISNGKTNFSDVKADAWYSIPIAWATQNAIVSGRTDGSFGADDPITREDLAVVLWRYSGKPESKHQTLQFTDAESISAYAKEAISWAAENNIMNGMGHQILNPKGKASRAQVAMMLMNFCEAQ